jgi:GH24 family phage-related lysozyme (muramidase)
VKISPTGIKLIKSFEGLSLTSYLCPVGVLTIGYGHTGNVLAGTKITEKEADALLKQDLIKFEQAVLNYVTIDLNQNQFDALVSFCFNVGTQAFKGSTLVKRLNNGENPNIVAAEELPRWNKGDGKVLEGLSRRRSAEVELFCSEAPKVKVGLIDITSKFNTWLKKRLVPSVELGRDEKANIYKGRTIRNCFVIDRKDKHSYVEMGFGLGKWWIYDDHWDGLVTKTTIHPYAIDGDLRYLRNFPYFHQKDNGPEGWRQCQTSSIAMCLKYLDTPGINDDTDY